MRLLIPILLLLLFAIPATAAESGYYIGPGDGVDLRLRPDQKATVSGHLDSNTAVEVIDRERNWTKIITIGRGIKGWVPAGAVRKSASVKASGSSSSFFSSFTSLFRSPEPTQKTAVLGVRGLEGGDDKVADKKAGEEAIRIVEWMDTLNVPQSEVVAFVKKGNLKP